MFFFLIESLYILLMLLKLDFLCLQRCLKLIYFCSEFRGKTLGLSDFFVVKFSLTQSFYLSLVKSELQFINELFIVIFQL